MTDDDRTIAKADRDILHAAATGEGLIPVDADGLQKLAEAAKAVHDQAADEFADMTIEQANFVRQLRVVDGYSWRAVAETCALEWGGTWGSNQLYGMAICEQAAGMLDGHYMDEVWN